MTKSYHIPSLDGLRAVSFAIVFMAHAGWNNLIPGPFGVTIFFFLSGYLITTLMRSEYDETGSVSLARFYLRRVLRILPPFYIVLLLSFAACWVGLYTTPIDRGATLPLALHYANYYLIYNGDGSHGHFPPGTDVYWSLAVEEHFYVLFPIIYLALRKRLRPEGQCLALLLLCGVLLAWRCVLVFGYDASFQRTGTASDTRFDSILFGCALAVYENPKLDASRLSERVWKWLLFPLGLLGLLVCFAIRSEEFRATVRYSIQGLSLIPLFVCAIRYPDWWPMRPFNVKPLAFIGTLSYSLYLTHLLAIEIVREQLPSLGQVPRQRSALRARCWCHGCCGRQSRSRLPACVAACTPERHAAARPERKAKIARRPSAETRPTLTKKEPRGSGKAARYDVQAHLDLDDHRNDTHPCPRGSGQEPAQGAQEGDRPNAALRHLVLLRARLLVGSLLSNARPRALRYSNRRPRGLLRSLARSRPLATGRGQLTSHGQCATHHEHARPAGQAQITP